MPKGKNFNNTDSQYSERNNPGLNSIQNSNPPPHDETAERSVLAAILLEPTPCADVAVRTIGSKPDVFYIPKHRYIYDAMMALHRENKTIDLISVANYLKRKQLLENIGGEIYLIDVQNRISSIANVENWCGILKEQALLRSMSDACRRSVDICFSKETSTDKILDKIEQDIYNVRFKYTDPKIYNLPEILEDSFTQLQDALDGKRQVGLSTGYGKLDELITGLKPGEMFVLAARPSIGKTSFALNVVRNVAMHKIKNENEPERKASALFFSLEMTHKQLARRLICMEAQMSEQDFYSKNPEVQASVRKKTSQLTSAVEALKDAEIFIDDSPILTITDMTAKARLKNAELKNKKHKLDVIIIDYLQLMKADGESRQQEVANISSGIKALAKSLNIPILVLAQLNREVEKAGSSKARPKLSHLRESGAIEQDADIVAFLHRDRREQQEQNARRMNSGLSSEIIIEKNRNGALGRLYFNFFPKWMRFDEATYQMPPEAADAPDENEIMH